MSNGVYGIKRGSDVNIEDVEIFISYAKNRNERSGKFTKIPSNEVLYQNMNPNGLPNEVLGGVYTMKLPKEYFSRNGIYNVYIRPLEIRTKITDVGNLATMPNIRGLVFNTSDFHSNIVNRFENDGLIGYRIEYLDKSVAGNPKINNLFRIITSNNKVEPVNVTSNNANQRSIRYNFSDNSTLIFCTVTPNSPTTAKPNVLPFIGELTQEVIISNTFFDPVLYEIEIVEYDTEDIAIGLFGNQTKSIEDGMLTMYNFENDIYKQFNLYEINDAFNDKPLYEVREQNKTIDESKDFNDIINLDE